LLKIKEIVFLLLWFVVCVPSLYPQKGMGEDTLRQRLYFRADSLAMCRLENYGLARPAAHGKVPASDFPALAERLVTRMENDGYPFAAVSLSPLTEPDSNGVVADFTVDAGPLVRYDSVMVKGTLKLRPRFVQAFLSWRPRRKYMERNVARIAQKMNGLPYATVTRETGVEFVGDKAYLYLFADKQKVNRFDGYLGLVPVSERTGKVMLTGEVNLMLQNVFKIGETLELRWQAPERRSQYLLANADFPYWFGTPFGLSGHFVLDKKDTSYLNMNYRIALTYSFLGSNALRLYFDYTTSSILRPELVTAVEGDTLSYDFRKPMYGISLNYSRLDDAIQPRSGVRLCADIAAGSRRILPNTAVDAEVYEGLLMRTTHYRMQGEVAGFVPIRKRWGWMAGVSGGMLLGNQQIYNDLFRIGGTRTLQGFDEMSLYASSYLIAQTEFRFWFARYSYLNVFFNGAWYERKLSGSYYYDYPFGFGLGATFHTKAGNFYISYALGQQRGNPVSFKTGKIHFGMDVRF
jgi:outer membrane protein assembly factor BamA